MFKQVLHQSDLCQLLTKTNGIVLASEAKRCVVPGLKINLLFDFFTIGYIVRKINLGSNPGLGMIR